MLVKEALMVGLERVPPVVINHPRVEGVPLPAILVTGKAPPVLVFLPIRDSAGALADLSKAAIPRKPERARLETADFRADC
jgi:hypothetical protein